MDAISIDENEVRAKFGDFVGDIVRPRANGAAPQAPREAIEFLEWLDPTGRHNLVAIDPACRAPPEGKTFEPDQRVAMAKWVDNRNNRLNLYYSVNEPCAGAPDKKLADRDIAAIRAVVADLDPRPGAPLGTEHARLKTIADAQGGQPAVVDSGGGLQLIWRLEEKLDRAVHAAAARAQGRSIAKILGGDAVIDAARLMRLPGTVNLPDAKKVARGRAPALSSVVAVGGSTSLPALAALYPPAAAAAEQPDADAEIAAVQAALDMTAIGGTTSLDDLDEPLRTRLQKMLARDPCFARLWNGDPDVLSGDDKSGSAFRAKLAWTIAREGGFTAQQFGEIAYAWPNAVLAGQDVTEIVTARTIARDRVRCGQPHAPERHFAPIPEPAAPSFWETAPLETGLRSSASKWALVRAQDAAAQALDAVGRPLVEGLLDEGTASVLFGESNVGKTFVAMDIAFHVATGLPWAGMLTARRGVLYVCAEGGPGVGKRCRAARPKFGNAFDDMPFLIRSESVDLLHPQADLRPLIEAALSCTEQIGLIVVDTLSRAMAGGDENSSIDMGMLVRHVDTIRRETGAHVLLVHHSGKDTAKGARGHSSLRAAVDTEIEVVAGQVVVRKQRDLDRSFQVGFHLEKVELGTDANGRPLSSCVVRLSDEACGERGVPTQAEAELLDVLVDLEAETTNAHGVIVKSIVDFFAAEGPPRSSGTVRMQLKRMREKGLVKKNGATRWASRSACCAPTETQFRENRAAFSAQQKPSGAQQDVFE